MVDIIEGPALITQLVKDCIQQEIVPDGLLEDVETFVPSYRLDENIIEPCIWLFEQETTSSPGENESLNHRILLQTPFEFVCVVYDQDDLEESEIKGKNLAGRVAQSIAKNFRTLDTNRKFISTRIQLEAIYPVGQVQIDEKDEKAVATSVRILFKYHVDWFINPPTKIKNVIVESEHEITSEEMYAKEIFRRI